jgi:hypothetical protein
MPKLAIIDDKEEYFEIKKVTHHIAIKINP